MAEFGRSSVDDGLEHFPAFVLPRCVAGDSVHVPNRFDGFRSV